MHGSSFTGQWFEKLIQNLSEGEGDRKRRSPRVGVAVHVPFSLIGDGRVQPLDRVRLRDVSGAGIGCTSSVRLRAGHLLIAAFTREEDSPLKVLCVVVHCRAVAEGLYIVGTRIKEIGIGDAEIHKLVLDSQPKKTATPPRVSQLDLAAAKIRQAMFDEPGQSKAAS